MLTRVRCGVACGCVGAVLALAGCGGSARPHAAGGLTPPQTASGASSTTTGGATGATGVRGTGTGASGASGASGATGATGSGTSGPGPSAAPGTTGAGATGPTGGTAAPVPAPTVAAYAAQPAESILGEAVAAIGAAEGYRAVGILTQQGRSLRASLAVHAPAAVAATLIRGEMRQRLVILGTSVYIRANLAFWQAQAREVPRRVISQLANRWFKTPDLDRSRLAGALRHLSPRVLARCLARAFRKPRVIGATRVDGAAAVILHSRGGGPGTSPGDLDVAVAAPHYPLRFAQTGPPRAGTASPCGASPTAGDGHAELTFSGWNDVRISAPPGATDLP